MVYNIRWGLDAAAADNMYNKRWPTGSTDRSCVDARTAVDVMFYMSQHPVEIVGSPDGYSSEHFFQDVKLRFVDALARWDKTAQKGQ